MWNAICTKPRTEKRVILGLEKLGIQAYCPMETRIHQWSDRKKKILIPIIPSYVFVRIDEKERHHVFQVSGVVRYLFWQGKPAIVKNFEIEAMKTALSGKVESVTVSHYKPGDRVRIPNGPFKDIEAILEKRDNKYLFLALEQTGLQIIIKLA